MTPNEKWTRATGITVLTILIIAGVIMLCADPKLLEYFIIILAGAIGIASLAGSLLIILGMIFQPEVKVYEEEQEGGEDYG